MKKVIPMNDLYAQYKMVKKDIDYVIHDVITHSSFIGGSYVTELEKQIALYTNTKYAISLNSGTDALYLSLKALGIQEGDEVITTPFTFIATAGTIALVGAKPVFVDVEPDTFNINPLLIEKAITKKTKAIVPVHLFGQPTHMDQINRIAKKHKLFVIEDACQAIGATWKNKKVGSIGNIGCFSFFPSKNLGAFGDGGILTTNNKKLAEKISLMKNHGSKIKYHNEIIGTNSRLDNLQAAILTVKLQHLDTWNIKRQEIANLYRKLLEETPWIQLPQNSISSTHVYHQFTLRIKNNQRNQLKEYLASHHITSMIYYPIPLHLLKAMHYLGYKKGDFPVSELLSREVLSLPIYPEMTKRQITYIAKTIKQYV